MSVVVTTMLVVYFFFFFSSRRRHTRLQGDWSSDVCSSDLQLAHAMRERGIAVEYGLRQAGVRKQLELASARGAARAVIIGPEERKDGRAVVRDLRAGTEAKVPLDKLLNGNFG